MLASCKSLQLARLPRELNADVCSPWGCSVHMAINVLWHPYQSRSVSSLFLGRPPPHCHWSSVAFSVVGIVRALITAMQFIELLARTCGTDINILQRISVSAVMNVIGTGRWWTKRARCNLDPAYHIPAHSEPLDLHHLAIYIGSSDLPLFQVGIQFSVLDVLYQFLSFDVCKSRPISAYTMLYRRQATYEWGAILIACLVNTPCWRIRMIVLSNDVISLANVIHALLLRSCTQDCGAYRTTLFSIALGPHLTTADVAFSVNLRLTVQWFNSI